MFFLNLPLVATDIEIIRNMKIVTYCQYLKDWEWMKIIFKIKPLISQAEEGKKMEELEKNYENVKNALERERKRRMELEEQAVSLEQEKNELSARMDAQNALLEDAEVSLILYPTLIRILHTFHASRLTGDGAYV